MVKVNDSTDLTLKSGLHDIGIEHDKKIFLLMLTLCKPIDMCLVKYKLRLQVQLSTLSTSAQLVDAAAGMTACLTRFVERQHDA